MAFGCTFLAKNSKGSVCELYGTKSQQDTPAEVLERVMSVSIAFDLLDGAVAAFGNTVGSAVLETVLDIAVLLKIELSKTLKSIER